MDYKVIGVYNEKKETSFNRAFLHTFNNKKYEIVEIPGEHYYEIKGNFVIYTGIKFPIRNDWKSIRLTDSRVFICYSNTLEIFNHKGKMIRKLDSLAPIAIYRNGFVLKDVTDFMVNFVVDTFLFLPQITDMIEFTSEGKVFGLLEDAGKQFLGSRTLDETTQYAFDGEILAELEEYVVFRDSAQISDVISVACVKVDVFENEPVPNIRSIDCIIALCKTFVFVIIDNIIVRKSLTGQFIGIVPERWVVHNYIDEVNISTCILLVNCFKALNLSKISGIEGFLLSLLNSGQHTTLADAFIVNLKFNTEKLCSDYATLICRVYRQASDNARLFLEKHIDFAKLDADQMFYVIIYKQQLARQFVNLCKKERRLFYLPDLMRFFIKTGRSEECKRMFLEAGLFIYEHRGFEKLYAIEKLEIESQRLLYLADFRAGYFEIEN